MTTTFTVDSARRTRTYTKTVTGEVLDNFDGLMVVRTHDSSGTRVYTVIDGQGALAGWRTYANAEPKTLEGKSVPTALLKYFA